MSATSQAAQDPVRREVDVRYDPIPTLYASHFLVTAQQEEVLLECAPGVSVDRAGGRSVMSVHTRLALNWTSARRLVDLLSRVIGERETWLAKNELASTRDAAAASDSPVARLPSFEA
jgi:hypothetical protein